MAFLSDPIALLVFAGAVALAFFAGRFGRKALLWWRGRNPQAPSGPPPSRQVRRAERRRQAKRDRD